MNIIRNYFEVGETVYIKRYMGYKNDTYQIKSKQGSMWDYMYCIEVEGQEEWFIPEALESVRPRCAHPKGAVYVNSANGIKFRYCKDCKQDLGNA